MSLNNFDYSIWNALTWQNCVAHYHEAKNKNNLSGDRFLHGILMVLESFPVISQFVSLIETGVVRSLRERLSDPPFQSEKVHRIMIEKMSLKRARTPRDPNLPRIQFPNPVIGLLLVDNSANTLEKGLPLVANTIKERFESLSPYSIIKDPEGNFEVKFAFSSLDEIKRVLPELEKALDLKPEDRKFLELGIDRKNNTLTLSSARTRQFAGVNSGKAWDQYFKEVMELVKK